MNDSHWKLYGATFRSRLLMGSALYSSPVMMRETIQRSATDIVTVALHRQAPAEQGGLTFWDYI